MVTAKAEKETAKPVSRKGDLTGKYYQNSREEVVKTISMEMVTT
jgi:hypothetical protein